MIPKKVVLENFLSFGAKQTLSFDDDEPLWVISGPNGIGKSAVFDAITFCLYGEHRGGAQNLNRLCRHGEKSYHVSFEFEFKGKHYRITRNRTIGKTVTAKDFLEEQTGGDWKPVANITGVAAIKGWIADTIGIEFAAFQSSVLLRQGEGDKIINAGGTDRMKMLRNILGLTRYEQLSQRCTEGRKEKDDTLKLLQIERERLPDVGIEDLEASTKSVLDAEEREQQAKQDIDLATERKQVAAQWQAVANQRQDIVTQLSKFDALIADGPTLERDARRCTTLESVVPKLVAKAKATADHAESSTKSEAANAKLAVMDTTLATAKKDAEAHRLMEATHREKASTLARDMDTARQKSKELDTKLNIAMAVEKLQAELAAYSPTLDAEASSAEAEKLKLQAKVNTAQVREGTLSGGLKTLQRQLKNFDTLGATCSLCGQDVDAEHAAKEKARLNREMAECTDELAVAEAQFQEYTVELNSNTKTLAKLQADARNQQALTAKLQGYTAAGATDTALSLKGLLDKLADDTKLLTAKQKAERDQQESAEDKLKDAEKREKAADTGLSSLRAEVTAHGNKLAVAADNLQRLTSELADWNEPTPTPELEKELSSYQQKQVKSRYEQLQQAAPLKLDRQDKLLKLDQELAAFPADVQLTTAVADAAIAQAKQAVNSAAETLQQAKQSQQRLEEQLIQRTKLLADVKAAEKVVGIHRKLDELLGRGKLQRELVREAEQEIVRLATNTLHALSGGEYSLELDESLKKEDEALVLLVRQAGSAETTPVQYLSGSQKFRVAISIALAIGQFSSGQDRPLESVIIDEGFGSLDKDGLRATADELNKLKGLLKRIILVSHQEEFTENFPVMYQLSKSDTGTVATKVRR